MGSFKRPRVFHPLDLEIMDRVFDAAWANLVNRSAIGKRMASYNRFWES
jgi:hypothetical protein